MENNYLLYKNISVSNLQKPEYYLSKDKLNCINMCLEENNCKDIVITNPLCMKENINLKENFDLKENFESGDIGELKKVNFCSNAIYKTIITLILTCILIYFIWYLCKKQYKDNNDSSILTTKTPFIN